MRRDGDPEPERGAVGEVGERRGSRFRTWIDDYDDHHRGAEHHLDHCCSPDHNQQHEYNVNNDEHDDNDLYLEYVVHDYKFNCAGVEQLVVEFDGALDQPRSRRLISRRRARRSTNPS